MDTLYQARARSPHLEIARRLRRSEAAPGIKAVVVGSRGSGKSTELARLAWEVRTEFLPIRLDLSGAFGGDSTALDLLVVLSARVERTARDWELPSTERRRALGAAVEKLGLTAGAFGALVAALEPVAAAAGAPGSLTTAGALLGAAGSVTRSLLRPLSREGLATDQSRLLDCLNGAVLDLRADGINDHPALFLVEGLDKLTDLATIRAAFRDVDLLGRLDSPLVLTAPVAVRHQPWVTSGTLRPFELWNAPVVRHDGAENAEGIDELVGMFDRRRRSANAPADLVHPDVVRQAARYASGNARELFRLLEAAMDRADALGCEVVEPEHFRHALVERRHELQLALRSEQLEILVELLERPGPLRSGEDADELLYENFVACYPNEDAWFRPHEILVPYLHRLRDLR